MTIWIIEPRDPLIVRDGRPFNADPGAWASSLPFPFPSTIAGGVRTRAGLDNDGFFKYPKGNEKELLELKQLGVRGPLLVQLVTNGSDLGNWLVPAPFDALLFDAKPTEVEMTEKCQSKDLIKQLVPLELWQDAQTDLDELGLWFVGQACHDKRKPSKKAPRYWYWERFQTWLQDPLLLCQTIEDICQLGVDGPVSEQRVHVSIDADKEIAKDGMLFGTSGLEFSSPGKNEQRLQNAKRLALAVDIENNHQFTPRAGLASFGGERRMVSWRKSDMNLPSCPKDIERTIIEDKACRLVLLTPACFQQGYLPTWLCTNAEQHGVTIDARAIVVQRPQVVSGWDLVLRKPKPSRRLVPAGTVLFLKLKGSESDIARWLQTTWMQCISDDMQPHPQDHISSNDQDRRDGFGLAVLGTWNGKPTPMQTKEKL
jgi:CRISPR-associated protein Cmr3